MLASLGPGRIGTARETAQRNSPFGTQTDSMNPSVKLASSTPFQQILKTPNTCPIPACRYTHAHIRQRVDSEEHVKHPHSTSEREEHVKHKLIPCPSLTVSFARTTEETNSACVENTCSGMVPFTMLGAE